MSKNVIIGIIAGIIAIGGGAAYFLTQGDDSDNQNSSETTSTQTTEQTETTQETPAFNPEAMANQPFVATMKGTTSEGSQYDATIEFDGQESTHFNGNVAEQTVEFYSTSDRYIVCSGGNCFEYNDRSTQPALPDYSYDEEEFDDFRDSASYQGEQPCPDGTCSACEIPQDGYTTTVYINSDGRVSQLDTSGAEGEFTITYEYKDVNITLPQNVQSIPS